MMGNLASPVNSVDSSLFIYQCEGTDVPIQVTPGWRQRDLTDSDHN
jgi:hypothetical protein